MYLKNLKAVTHILNNINDRSKDSSLIDWVKRTCPICGSDDFSTKPIAKSSPRAEQLNFSQAKEYFIGFRKNQVFFSYYRCKNCKLLYCPWYFSEEQLNELYSDMPDNLLGESENIIAQTQEGYVKYIAKYLKRVNTYLEIGPDIGLVTNKIVKLFSPTNLFLIEPNITIHSQLIKNAGTVSNVKIFSRQDQLEQCSPDLCVGVHVYDHLLNPLKELSQLCHLSADEGIIAIVVHNEKSLLSKILKNKWPPFCLQHPQLFNKRTLSSLLLKADWLVINSKPTTNWFTLEHFISMGISLFGLNLKLNRFIPKTPIPIRFGNMIVIAVKNAKN